MNDDNDTKLEAEYIPRHAKIYQVPDYIEKKSANSEQNKEVRIIKRRKRRRPKKWVWKGLLVVAAFITVFSIVKIILWINDNHKISKIVDNINENTEIIETEDDENTKLINEDEDTSSDYWYYITFPLIDVDFTNRKSINSDTVGWINVNNTNINYPFVQYKDNDFYLNHSFDRSYNEAGWVFMDYRNSSDLDNKNTILYAHSRLDKTMFGSLSKTLKQSWYSNKDNHIIRLSTEKENTLWQIFSVYKIEEESYYITTKFNSDTAYQNFLDTIKERSLYDFHTNLTVNDRILTLSTCYSDTERTVVHAKLIKQSIRT